MYFKSFKLAVLAVLTIAAVAAWNISVNLNSQKTELSDISLANVEALASEGYSGGGYYKNYCSNYNNYYKCSTHQQPETCLGPNPPYPC
jgi:hypothetical protein